MAGAGGKADSVRYRIGPLTAYVPVPDFTAAFRKASPSEPVPYAVGPALGRAMTVSAAVEAHLPQGAYWYLHIAGCDPTHQGKGLGGAAIGGGLDRLATGRLPAYLETATEANLGLYQRYGFQITAEWKVPRGGPTYWSMWREA